MVRATKPSCQVGYMTSGGDGCAYTCRTAQLELAILLYMTGRYDDAWLQLCAFQESSEFWRGGEREDDRQRDDLRILIEKARLSAEAAHW